ARAGAARLWGRLRASHPRIDWSVRMSKASSYRIPIKTTKSCTPPRRPRSSAAGEERVPESLVGGVAESRLTYHPAPQFRRNRRFWLRRIALAKVRELR